MRRVIAAPWRFALQPNRAAAEFISARWTHVVVSYLIAMLILSATATVHFFANQTIGKQTGVALSGPTFDPDDVSTPDAGHTTWDSIRDPILRYRATILFVLLPMGTSGLALFMAWLLLPIVHVGGSVGQSFILGFRGIASGAGFLIVCANILWIALHLWHAWLAADESIGPLGSFIVVVGVWISLISLLCWISAALRSIRASIIPTERPLRCEGCGYDLTHRSPSGLCTECGLNIDESLTTDRRRNLAPVSFRTTGIKPWIGFSANLLLHGQHTYSRMAIRKDPALAARFRQEHQLAIALLAAMWIGTCLTVSFVNDDLGANRNLLVQILIGVFALSNATLIISLAAWGLNRLVGAVVSSYWFVRGMLPVAGDAETVIGLEFAFLWVICLYNGTLISSFFLLGDNWITETFGWQFWNVLLGMPTEPAVILIGNAALIVWWMVRMHRAFLAVRWANY